MDEALLLICELETFRLLDEDRPRNSPKVCSVDELKASLIFLKLGLKCYVLTFKRNKKRQETQQVALNRGQNYVHHLDYSSYLLYCLGNTMLFWPPSPTFNVGVLVMM